MDDDTQKELDVTAIHDERGYKLVREYLGDQYNLSKREPNIQVYEVNVKGDRAMTLRHIQHDRKPLGDTTNEVLKHLHRLWGFDIRLDSISDDVIQESFFCPPKDTAEK
jgi:spore cortex formation protein SpoVR/YcgB (stage V sporulation)